MIHGNQRRGTTKDAEMPPDTLDRVPTCPGRGVRWLAVAHVAAGVATALLANAAGIDFDIASGLFSGLWLGQTSLLGIWCGLGTNKHWKRLAGGVLGVGVLHLLAGFESGDLSNESLVFLGVATTVVATLLLIARCFQVIIHVDCSPATRASRLQFSIRHLLILTFMVACVVTLGKMVQPPITQWLSLLEVAVYAVMYIVVGLVPVWLILATKRPVPYGIGLVAVSACSAYCVVGIISVEALICVATGAMVVMVSLLVVRRCGYRLVRLPRQRPKERCHDENEALQASSPATQSGSLSQ